MGNITWKGILVALLLIVASLFIYNFLDFATTDLLTRFGITNPYGQFAIVMGAICLILIILGWPVKRIYNRIMGN